VEVTVHPPQGHQARLDDGRAHRGMFTTAIRLRAGQSFAVTTSRGTARRTSVVRCLPADFPGWEVERTGRQEAKFYVTTPTYATSSRYIAIFDRRGIPVWWMRGEGLPVDASLLPNGHVAWSPGGRGGTFGKSPRDAFEERRLDGRLVHRWRALGRVTDFHDFQMLPNGNALLITYPVRRGVDLRPWGKPAGANVLDAEVQEITPRRRRVWSWRSTGVIGLAETGRWWAWQGPNPLLGGGAAFDAVHLNSVEPDGRAIVVSARHLDAVYAISRRTGRVIWKLGGTPTPRSLRVRGGHPAGGPVFGGQHDARVLPDGTVTVYDNGTLLGRPPRAVRYRIDLRHRTATLVEQILDPGLALVSGCCGSARRLPHGHWVIDWTSYSHFAEYDPRGHRVFRLSFAGGVNGYRVEPVVPGRVSRAALRAGMDRMHPRRR
jgi:hypothetical protein